MVKAGWDKETVAIYELLFFAAHLLSFAWSTGVNNALLAYYHTQDQDVLILGTVQALVIGIVLWSVIRFIWLLAVLTSYSSGRFDNLMFKAFAWFSVPLILQFALSSGMEYVDGIIVNQYFDSQSFPIFRYGSRELPITMILVVALSSAMIPLAVKDLESTLSEIKERTKRLIHFLFPLSIILILISPYVYSLVYSEAYRASAQLFNIYIYSVNANTRLWIEN